MRVAIAGTGLIGASVGLAARAAGYGTAGWDRNPAHARTARELGALDEAAADLERLVESADVVVLATPLDATIELLENLPASQASLLTDVASVKAPVAAAAAGMPNFVAGHPLAGSQRSGPETARADLFRGRVWAYVPSGDPALDGRARDFFTALGAVPLAVDAARHDAVVALTSHMPQAVSTSIGALLAERLEDPLVAALCGSGMRSMTRLAASSWAVWGSVLQANAGPVAQEVRRLAGVLRTVADALEAGEPAKVAELFGRAAAGALGANDDVAYFVNPGTPNVKSEPR